MAIRTAFFTGELRLIHQGTNYQSTTLEFATLQQHNPIESPAARSASLRWQTPILDTLIPIYANSVDFKNEVIYVSPDIFRIRALSADNIFQQSIHLRHPYKVFEKGFAIRLFDEDALSVPWVRESNMVKSDRNDKGIIWGRMVRVGLKSRGIVIH
jgi:hypothetical protein